MSPHSQWYAWFKSAKHVCLRELRPVHIVREFYEGCWYSTAVVDVDSVWPGKGDDSRWIEVIW